MPRERAIVAASVSTGEAANTAYSVAGRIKDAEATAIKESIVEAAAKLRLCSNRRIPDTVKQHPRT